MATLGRSLAAKLSCTVIGISSISLKWPRLPCRARDHRQSGYTKGHKLHIFVRYTSRLPYHTSQCIAQRWTNGVHTNHSATQFMFTSACFNNASATSVESASGGSGGIFHGAACGGLCQSATSCLSCFLPCLYLTIMLRLRRRARFYQLAQSVLRSAAAHALCLSRHNRQRLDTRACSFAAARHSLQVQPLRAAFLQGAAAPSGVDARAAAQLRSRRRPSTFCDTPGSPPGFSGAASARKGSHSTSAIQATLDHLLHETSTSGYVAQSLPRAA